MHRQSIHHFNYHWGSMFGKNHRLRSLLFGVVLVSLATAGSTGQAHASTTWRQISNLGNGKCVDSAREDATKANPKIQLWSCVNIDSDTDGWEQLWQLQFTSGFGYSLRNRMTNKCLTPRDFPLPAALTADVCGGHLSDFWDLTSDFDPRTGRWFYTLKNHQSGLCLDIHNSSSTNGTVLEQWYCDSTSSAQKWVL